jgi:hypothetical protein
MSGDDGIAPPMDAFQPRPDEKGPRMVAVLLIIGSFLLVYMASGDIVQSFSENLSQEELDTLLNAARDQGLEITDEEYQDYHDEVRSNGAYAIRGFGIALGGVMIGIGGFLLFRLKSKGAKIALFGAAEAFVCGVYGSWLMASISKENGLPESLIIAHEWITYACGACLLFCGAIAGLPLINTAARAALDQRVTLVVEEE